MSGSVSATWLYSLRIVLKQCGHVATTFLILWRCNVSMFWLANIWNRYSLPMRLAGSPVQVSSAPSTAKLTPALTKMDAMARVTSTPRSTKAPEHPTQNSTSASGFCAMVGTSTIPLAP